ncbi:MAG: zinc-ribbon domain-containing protein [Candidatus Baldrarchaeia archaeon]
MAPRRLHYHGEYLSEFGAAVMFLVWGLLSWFADFPGTSWFVVLAAFLFVDMVRKYYEDRKIKNLVLNTITTYKTVSLESLARELRIRIKDLRRVILDLRAEGLLKAEFDVNTGILRIIEEQRFCPYCGSYVPPGASFCPKCGSSLE